MFSVLVIRLRSLRLLRVSGIVMRLRMFLLRSEERFSRNAETDIVCRLLLVTKYVLSADFFFSLVLILSLLLFFVTYTPPPEIYTLSLHDALPISILLATLFCMATCRRVKFL